MRAGGGVVPTVCRLSNAYGPGQRDRHLSGRSPTMDSALRHEPLRLLADFGSKHSCVYVDDVAHRADGRGPARGSTADAQHRQRCSRRAVRVGQLRRRRCRRGHAEIVRETAHSFDRRDSWLDCSSAESALGWRAAVPLEGPGPNPDCDLRRTRAEATSAIAEPSCVSLDSRSDRRAVVAACVRRARPVGQH
jgi:nucleoside-diphosphate-sugar epimerase